MYLGVPLSIVTPYPIGFGQREQNLLGYGGCASIVRLQADAGTILGEWAGGAGNEHSRLAALNGYIGANTNGLRLGKDIAPARGAV